jgi:hypothetical protein
MRNLFKPWPMFLLLPALLSACSGVGGPKIDRKDPPAGGTAAEFAYQIANNMAEQGYCDRAMPIFVCLASQGNGWEVAAHQAGTCGPQAAQLWQAPKAAPEPITREEPRGRRRNRKIRLQFEFQNSPDTVRAEGVRQLRRAANANWPEAQAELALQLASAGGADQAEARHWMERYDQNARRKIYGGNAIPIEVRRQLAAVPRTGAGGTMWTPIPFAAEDLHNRSCNQLLGVRPGQKQKTKTPVVDDGVEKVKPRSPADTRQDETVPRQGQGNRRP